MPFTVDKRKKSVFLEVAQNVPNRNFGRKKSQTENNMENMYSCTGDYGVITYNGKG